MIAEGLRPQALLIPPGNLAKYLRAQIDNDPSAENLALINACLLDQIHTEAIPSTVYFVWLLLAYSHSRHLVVNALQDPSRGVRWAGIRVARNYLFRGANWKEDGWDVLGGAQGIKDILDGLPLAEARLLLQAILAHPNSRGNRQVVMECMDELLTLIESANAWTTRSLSQYASRLYAYATAEKVTEFLGSERPMRLAIVPYLRRFHTNFLRRIAAGAIQVPYDVRTDVVRLGPRSLLGSDEAYVPVHYKKTHPSMPPALVFSMDMLISLDKNPQLLRDYEIDEWLNSILSLALHRKLLFQQIMPILDRSLALCRSQHHGNWLSRPFPEAVVQFWSISRFGGAGGFVTSLTRMFQRRCCSGVTEGDKILLEQCLIDQVLRIKDDTLTVYPSRAQFTKAVTSFLSLVDMKGRLTSLQLLCQHSPTLKFDLTVWPPSKKERELVPVWDYNVLRMLSPDSSKVLFDRSLYIHRCDEFLPNSNGAKGSPRVLSWTTLCNLWVSWEFSAADGNDSFPTTRKGTYSCPPLFTQALVLTEAAVSKMKTKAEKAREPDGRSKWAERALTLAAKTESFDIFSDVVKWSKRFLRDPLVFPNLIREVFRSGGRIFACSAALKVTKPSSNLQLAEILRRAHEIVVDLLETSLLLLREPWARNSQNPHIGFTTESPLVKLALDPLILIFMDFEREGNAEGQTDVYWSGPSSLIGSLTCPKNPSTVELAFIDRIAQARDEFWKEHRARMNPDVLTLGAGWPRGLPIQYLVKGETYNWLYHATRRPDEAPYLASRINEVLFAPLDTIMAGVPKDNTPISKFVDSFSFAINALPAEGEPTEKVPNMLRVWEHHVSKLQAHPLYLKLFQDWLYAQIRHGKTAGTAHLIKPDVSAPIPIISSVPTGPEVIEWDPQDLNKEAAEADLRNNEEVSEEVLCTVLTCRLNGAVPTGTRSVTVNFEPKPKAASVWSFGSHGSRQPEAVCPAGSCVVDSLVLSALLFLDTYTKKTHILRTRFPDVAHPRYTPIYLADEFIMSMTKDSLASTLARPVKILRNCVKRVPSRLLRDLIWSLLDTLTAEPNSPMYSKLLFCTLDLIQILLSTDQPQLAIDVVIRLWKDFAQESSCHRKLNLVKIGQIIGPKQATEMMESLAAYVCDALETQQQQKQGEGTVTIKVTTAKMLAQVLTEANFLPQSIRMRILRDMFNISRHIDIRQEIAASVLALVSESESAEPYEAFASIALSAAGPNERVRTTEEEWIAAESSGAPLPSVASGSERPILNLMVTAAATQIPVGLRSDYVHKILLPVIQESARQHARWMSCMVSKMGLSLSDLGITELEIGPFSSDLIDKILWQWTVYLPVTYLQHRHRSWALSYLRFASFNRIAKGFIGTTDPTLKDINVREHWNEFLQLQRARAPLYRLNRLLVPATRNSSDDYTAKVVLENFLFRAEVIAKNPIKYKPTLGKYVIYPGYTLEMLKELRKTRLSGDVGDPVHREKVYEQTTRVMRRIIDVSVSVRREAWSTELAAGYPVSPPSAFEHDLVMLPSPIYNPAASESDSAADIFVSAIIDLTFKHARDSLSLLKLDALQSAIREIPTADMPTCALRLGRALPSEDDVVEACIRVRLLSLLLASMREKKTVLDGDVLEMVEEWKHSDSEAVRQVGWECEW
ncbi:Receptor-type tyrosine-protein phosphatase zeta [Talaromyces islandicus]|uniref:Receptor-type tyrosine-protein phosphatase zeta n=1 Tax=Talaromyces islandicus TaxID=28573 RepID=A0A0U1LM68_TALIS|nr:Receptor-type tyrosine-protein phosphatase zeta [Talaromyces islandicus]